jgi:hypothetical protein
MLLKNLADLAKATQGAVEDYFGLHAKAEPSPWDGSLKAYKPLCKILGVSLFGVELVLYSPTSKPVLRLAVEWSFDVGNEDEDESPLRNRWSSEALMNEQHDRHSPPRPPLSAEAELRRVDLSVFLRAGGAADMTDLRCHISEKLKGAFPKVVLDLSNRR